MLPVIAQKTARKAGSLAKRAGTALARPGTFSWMRPWGWVSIAAFGIYWVVRKVTKYFLRNRIVKNYDQNTPATRAMDYAYRFHSGMVRTWEWLSKFLGDGTSYKTVLAVAAEVKEDPEVSFDMVSRIYKQEYNLDLIGHLQSELDENEMRQFNDVLRNGLGGLAVPHILVTTKPAIIYNQSFQKINQVKAGVKLGQSYEVVSNASGSYDVFYHNNQVRLVSRANTKHIYP